ncbi:MAG TPA: GGDEF domain-containing protein [bacterium]|nr:GGDEF domain-containing protein [bacterium]
MRKRQLYALAGFLVGAGAPSGALLLQYLVQGRPSAPILFVDAQWNANAFFYWYMFLGTSIILAVLGYLLGRWEDRQEHHRRWTQYSLQLDPVTGVVGPVQFGVLSRSVFEKFPKEGHSLSALALELNGFEDLNRRYGHSFGLGALRDLAWLLHFATREGDLITRQDQQFLCLLPQCDGEAAAAVVKRLQDSLESQTFHHEGERVHFRVSAGIATLDSPKGQTLEALFNRAKDNLAEALHRGPGQVCRTQIPSSPEPVRGHQEAEGSPSC